jgi:hypothetical protein
MDVSGAGEHQDPYWAKRGFGASMAMILKTSVAKDFCSVRRSRGTLVAKLLSRVWRCPPLSPPDINARELEEILNLILVSGTGPLAWWRIRNSQLAHTPAAERLHTAYRVQSLKAAEHQLQIGPLIDKFRTHGIDPILMKGWSLARLYPEAGLRPYSDVDLIIPTEDVEAVLSLLAGGDGPAVDLEHDEITRFDYRIWSDIHQRSRLVSLGNSQIRVLSSEDQLRALCIHFLKHGGCGPLSLCDIALFVESRPESFDWDVCLGKGRKQRSWITCALLLAHRLLGMGLEGVPLEFDSDQLPGWVVATVVEQWGRSPSVYRADFRSYARHPSKIREAIADRWPPNPIVATLTSGACFGAWPPPVLQFAEILSRFGRWLLAGAETVPAQPGVRTNWA